MTYTITITDNNNNDHVYNIKARNMFVAESEVYELHNQTCADGIRYVKTVEKPF